MKKIFTSISKNLVEYYTLIVLVIVIPYIVGSLTTALWGNLLSFTIQAIIGILYVKADIDMNKDTKG